MAAVAVIPLRIMTWSMRRLSSSSALPASSGFLLAEFLPNDSEANRNRSHYDFRHQSLLGGGWRLFKDKSKEELAKLA